MLNLNKDDINQSGVQPLCDKTNILGFASIGDVPIEDSHHPGYPKTLEARHEKTDFAYVKTNAPISCAIKAQLISAFVFTT